MTPPAPIGRRLAFLWARHRLPLIGLLAALCLAALFAARFLFFAAYWSDPANRALTIEGWMTPGYVAHAHGLPPEFLREGLGLARSGPRLTLEEIAAARGMSSAALIAELEAILSDAGVGR